MQRQTPPSQLVCTQAEGYVGPVPNRQQRVPPRGRVHPSAHSLRIPGDEPSPAHLLQVAPRAQRATPARAPASSRRASAAAAVPRGAQAQATAPRRARSAAQPAPRLPWPCAACAAPARPVPCWCALPAYPSTFGCLFCRSCGCRGLSPSRRLLCPLRRPHLAPAVAATSHVPGPMLARHRHKACAVAARPSTHGGRTPSLYCSESAGTWDSWPCR